MENIRGHFSLCVSSAALTQPSSNAPSHLLLLYHFNYLAEFNLFAWHVVSRWESFTILQGLFPVSFLKIMLQNRFE